MSTSHVQVCPANWKPGVSWVRVGCGRCGHLDDGCLCDVLDGVLLSASHRTQGMLRSRRPLMSPRSSSTSCLIRSQSSQLFMWQVVAAFGTERLLTRSQRALAALMKRALAALMKTELVDRKVKHVLYVAGVADYSHSTLVARSIIQLPHPPRRCNTSRAQHAICRLINLGTSATTQWMQPRHHTLHKGQAVPQPSQTRKPARHATQCGSQRHTSRTDPHSRRQWAAR